MKSLIALCMFVLCLCPQAKAQDERADLVRRIAVAQGLTQMFDVQLQEHRDAAVQAMLQIYRSILAESGGAEKPKARQAYERFALRASRIFSADEMVTAWSSRYGNDVSVEDLRAILRYYESPLGKKDVSTSHLAMQSFTAWFVHESNARTASLVASLAEELRNAAKR